MHTVHLVVCYQVIQYEAPGAIVDRLVVGVDVE